MLFKSTDDKSSYAEFFKSTLARQDIALDARRRLEVDYRNHLAGERCERDAAYLINMSYGPGKNWAVLHDLRFEHEGQVAQIDHILINRVLDCYVMESKSVSEGVGINAHGEFVRFYKGTTQGIPSPLEQNRRHILVLQRMMKSGAFELPRRLGLPMPLAFHSLILLSTSARVSRPKQGSEDLKELIKVDQLPTYLDKAFESANLLKVVSSETLESVAKSILAHHRPAPGPSLARYGIAPVNAPATTPIIAPVSSTSAALDKQSLSEAPSSASSSKGCQGCAGAISPAEEKFCKANHQRFNGRLLCKGCQSAASHASKVAPASNSEAAESRPQAEAAQSKLACAKCSVQVPYAVAKFCWTQKARFSGKVYCRDCQ